MASLATPAAASLFPYVTTLSEAFVGANNNYDSVTGLSPQAGSCFLQGGGTGPCATLSSNPSTNILGLTAASVVISNGVSFDPQNGVTGFGDASASANLATGTVGAYVTGPLCSPSTPNCGDGGTAAGEMQDMLTFSNTTGHTVDIDVFWSFDGTIDLLGAFPRTQVTSLFCLGPGTLCSGNANSPVHGPNAGGQAFYFTYQDGSVMTNSAPTSGWVSVALLPGANAASEIFHGVYAIPAGVSTDSLNAYLQLDCAMSTCDFSHTGALSIGPLPTGVTFTSGSGVLLSAAVPEPGTWALLLCGAALMGLRRKR